MIDRPILLEIFWRPLAQQKSRVLSLFLALIVLAAAQGVLPLLMVGPLLKALFYNSSAPMPIQSLLPAKLLAVLPLSPDTTVDHALLVAAVPVTLVIAAIVRSLAMYV